MLAAATPAEDEGSKIGLISGAGLHEGVQTKWRGRQQELNAGVWGFKQFVGRLCQVHHVQRTKEIGGSSRCYSVGGALGGTRTREWNRQ